jgi:hypothetical protein
MSIRIQSGPAQVVEHGTVTACWGNSIFLEVEISDSKTAVELIFDESGEGDAAIDTEYTESGVRLQCRRFGQARGRGSSEPVLLGELEDSLLLFHFRVFRYGKSVDRTVHYSFFRVMKDHVDWKPLVEDQDSG